ncbi:MAG TPA: crotonase, partial [Rhodocyclaceae bacterium]|nr:crotonase [Rhodocyclaceae bacterium]
MEFKNWKLHRDADGVVWAILDRAGASANTLAREVLHELEGILDEMDREPPKGLVFRSGKAAGFIAGADIEEFTQCDTPEKARALVKLGWDVYNRL